MSTIDEAARRIAQKMQQGPQATANMPAIDPQILESVLRSQNDAIELLRGEILRQAKDLDKLGADNKALLEHHDTMAKAVVNVVARHDRLVGDLSSRIDLLESRQDPGKMNAVVPVSKIAARELERIEPKFKAANVPGGVGINPAGFADDNVLPGDVDG